MLMIFACVVCTTYLSKMVCCPYFPENHAGENVPKSKGYCAPYNGQVCRKYLQGRGLVWFNISQDNSGGWLNEEITQNLKDELISKLKPPCQDAAEALLCKYAFPDCKMIDGNSVGLPICYEDCMAVRNHYCFKDWALIEDNKRRKIVIQSRGHFRLPQCDHLPRHNNGTKKCTQSEVTIMRWDKATSEYFTTISVSAKIKNLFLFPPQTKLPILFLQLTV